MTPFRHTLFAALLFAFVSCALPGCRETAPEPEGADIKELVEEDGEVSIDLGEASDAPTVEPATVEPATVEPATVEPATVEPATEDAATDDASEDEAPKDDASDSKEEETEAPADAAKDSSAALETRSASPVFRLASYNAAGKWGTLKGKFVYDGKAPTPKKLDVAKEPGCKEKTPVDESIVVGEEGGLANVFVYLYVKRGKKAPEAHPDYAKEESSKVTVDNQMCRFEPHTQTLRTSQTLEIKNSDKFGHNTKYESLKQSFNRTIPVGQTEDFTLSKSENFPVKVVCNIHPWMSGYVLVRDNPYMATTGKDGTFEIKNLPVGEHEFVFWQESAGNLKKIKFDGGVTSTRGRAKIKIKEGDNDLGEIKISPKKLKK